MNENLAILAEIDADYTRETNNLRFRHRKANDLYRLTVFLLVLGLTVSLYGWGLDIWAQRRADQQTADALVLWNAELAAKDAEEFGTKDNIENIEQTDGVQILGRDAVKVSCVLKSEYMDLKRDIYYFGSNGANYKVQILAPTECFDEFSEMVTALTDTIEIK